MDIELWLILSPLAISLLHLAFKPIRRQLRSLKYYWFMANLYYFSKKHQGIIIRNAAFPVTDDTTIDVDYVLLCNKGLFLINCHAWKGRVFGQPLSPTLTIKMAKTFYKFDNPYYTWHSVDKYFDNLFPDRPIPRYFTSLFLNADMGNEQPGFFFNVNKLMTYIQSRPSTLNGDDVKYNLRFIKEHC